MEIAIVVGIVLLLIVGSIFLLRILNAISKADSTSTLGSALVMGFLLGVAITLTGVLAIYLATRWI